MCKKPKGLHNRIDKCMKPLIKHLKRIDYNTHACCCGHNRYPMTIVVSGRFNGREVFYDLLSDIDIPRTRNFYKKDKQGYYYIPEISKPK